MFAFANCRTQILTGKKSQLRSKGLNTLSRSFLFKEKSYCSFWLKILTGYSIQMESARGNVYRMEKSDGKAHCIWFYTGITAFPYITGKRHKFQVSIGPSRSRRKPKTNRVLMGCTRETVISSRKGNKPGKDRILECVLTTCQCSSDMQQFVMSERGDLVSQKPPGVRLSWRNSTR